MTAIVLDASAALELICRTTPGANVDRLITANAIMWGPDGIFDVEVNAALRRLEMRGNLNTRQCSAARRLSLGGLRLRRRRVAPLADRAWSLRPNLTFPDAGYVALAEALDRALLTDMKLVDAPTLPVASLHPQP